jgi:DNA-binding response OmpR family regulator
LKISAFVPQNLRDRILFFVKNSAGADFFMKILLLEDEIKVASFVKSGLEQAQNTVDVAANIAEADFLAAVNSYDLMIFDCLLPDGDGRNFCRVLRAKGVITPILLLTAKTAVEDKVAGLDSGADDYLTKPFAFNELLARVRALGRRRNSPLLQPLAVADLQIDPLTHKVTRGGKFIAVTPNEYKVLEMLLRHAGQIVTRTDLLEQVWGMNFDPSSNIVDVVIKVLRDKIDRPFEPKLIQTVRGFGYRIRTDFD